ncbi:MAG: ATP-binding cassette domain-containing protein, partial [Rhodococcus sp.]|nr:ATP-binding cassette domain-containing protein [Rhodococcus sp. (in: high G+C Gram-positive bacteria)]
MSAAPEPPDVVELRGISKRFDKTVALNEISLSVQKGECLVLAGPSGAGKTTMLRVIAGLERADDGTVMFEGK